MKRQLLLIGLICGLFALTALTNRSLAQKAGGDLITRSSFESIGIRANGVYGFGKQLRGAADIAFFFPRDLGGLTQTIWAVNVNGHYQFNVGDRSHAAVNVYGLAGLNITSIHNDFGSLGTQSESKVGINIGFGVEYPLDFADLYGEVKRTFNGIDQPLLAAGVRIPIPIGN